MADTFDPKLTHAAGTFDEALKASRRSAASYGLEGDALAKAERLVENQRMMLSDAANQVSPEIALSNTDARYSGVPGVVPENRVHIKVDTDKMLSAIDKDVDMTHDQKVKYRRAVQIIDGLQKKNLTLSKAESGRFWIESNEDGSRLHARNNIAEVGDLLSKYMTAGDKIAYDTVTPKVITDGNGNGDNGSGSKLVDVNVIASEVDKVKPFGEYEEAIQDIEPYEFSPHDNKYLLALGTDLGTTLASYVAKVTGAGYVPGMVIDAVGGLTSLGLNAAADYANPDVSPWEMAAGIGLDFVAQGTEAITSVPTGMARSMYRAAKPLKAALRYYSNANKAGALFTGELGETTSKILNDEEDFDIQDYRNISLIINTLLGGAVGVGVRAKAKKDMAKSVAEVENITDKELGRRTITKENKPLIDDLKKVKKDQQEKTKKLVAKAEADAKAKVTTKDSDIAAARATVTTGGPVGDKNLNQVELDALTKRRQDLSDKAAAKKRNTGRFNKKEQEKFDTYNKRIKELEDNNAEIDAFDQKLKDVSKKVSELETEKATIAKDLDTQKATIKKDNIAESKRFVADIVAKAKAKSKEKLNKAVRAEEDAILESFGNASGQRIIRKGTEKTVGKQEAKARLKKVADDKAKIADADTKLGKAKEKVKKLQAAIGTNPTKEQTNELNLAKDDVTKFQKRRDHWTSRFIRNSKSFVVDKLGTPAAVGLDRAWRLTGPYYKGYGISTDVNTVTQGALGDLLTGNRYHQYNRDEVERRIENLYGKGAVDTSKYTLHQLREILKRAEADEKGDDYKKDGRRKPASKTSLIPKASKGLSFVMTEEGPVRKFQDSGSLTDSDAPEELNNQDKIAAEKAKKELETELMKRARLDAILNAATVPDQYKPAKSSNLEYLWKYVKPADFGSRSSVQISRYPIEKIKAPVLEVPQVTHMPNFGYGMHQLDKTVKADTADSYAAHNLKLKLNNERAKNKLALIAKDADYISKGKAAAQLGRNERTAAAAQASVQNTLATNAALASFAEKENAARAAAKTQNIAAASRVINGLFRGIGEYTEANRRDNLLSKYNVLANLQSIYESEYKPQIDALVASGANDANIKARELKASFARDKGISPDELAKAILDIRNAYSTPTTI